MTALEFPAGDSRSAPVLFKFPTSMGAKPQGFLKISGQGSSRVQ
jgi:hypothetical protein